MRRTSNEYACASVDDRRGSEALVTVVKDRELPGCDARVGVVERHFDVHRASDVLWRDALDLSRGDPARPHGPRPRGPAPGGLVFHGRRAAPAAPGRAGPIGVRRGSPIFAGQSCVKGGEIRLTHVAGATRRQGAALARGSCRGWLRLLLRASRGAAPAALIWRRIQSGNVQQYALGMVAGAVFLAGYFWLWPF